MWVHCTVSTCVTEANWRQCGMLWPKEISFSEHSATYILYIKISGEGYLGDIDTDVPTNQNIGGDVSPASPAGLTPVAISNLLRPPLPPNWLTIPNAYIANCGQTVPDITVVCTDSYRNISVGLYSTHIGAPSPKGVAKKLNSKLLRKRNVDPIIRLVSYNLCWCVYSTCIAYAHGEYLY